jgi:hypothetical protein
VEEQKDENRAHPSALTYRQNGKDLSCYEPVASTIASAGGLPQIFAGGNIDTCGSSGQEEGMRVSSVILARRGR